MTKAWSIVSLTCFGTGIEGKAAAHGLFVDVLFRLRKHRVEQTASYLIPQFSIEGEAKKPLKTGKCVLTFYEF